MYVCMYVWKRLDDQLDDSIYTCNPISRQMKKIYHLMHYTILTVDTGSVDVMRLANAKSSHAVG